MSTEWALTVRADANHTIGYGHVMRSLAIAESVAEAGDVRIRYAVSGESKTAPIEERGFALSRVSDLSVAASLRTFNPEDGPLLLDTYAVQEDDLDALRCAGYAVALVDDGCRLRSYSANIVVDPSPGALTQPYKGDGDTRFLLGAAYFPLRRALRDRIPGAVPPSRVQRVLVTLGGSDPDDATTRIVEALKGQDDVQEITVVLGPSYDGQTQEGVHGAIRVIRDPDDYADLVAAAALVITSAGGSALECAALGRPLLVLVLSDDQCPNALALGEAGAAVSLGELPTFDGGRLRAALAHLLAEPARREQLGRNGSVLVDGQGAARVARAIKTLWDRHPAKTAT